MVISNQPPFTLHIALTLACASGLTTLLVWHAPTGIDLIAIAIVLTLFLSQLSVARHHVRQLQRTDRYHRLGRKLMQLKQTKKRDESTAIKVLNHIVNQSSCKAGQTTIWQKPLETFSGDLALTTYTDDERSYTLLADLTGHGIAAAMGATPVASIFQATANRGLSVEEILVELNNKLTHLLPSGYFCCVAIVMCHNRQLHVCNAGLPPLLITNAHGVINHRIESNQLPLGIENLKTQDVSTFSKLFDEPHQIYAYTDGLTEARSEDNRIFSEQTLESLVTQPLENGGRLGKIQSSFESFIKGATQSDDISIVEVNIC